MVTTVSPPHTENWTCVPGLLSATKILVLGSHPLETVVCMVGCSTPCCMTHWHHWLASSDSVSPGRLCLLISVSQKSLSCPMLYLNNHSPVVLSLRAYHL